MSRSVVAVAVEEVRFTRELEDVKLNEVGVVDAVLECELSKDGQKVDWHKDSKKIRADLEHDVVVEGRVHRLVIRKAAAKHVGTYRADYMHLSTSAKLAIEGTVVLAAWWSHEHLLTVNLLFHHPLTLSL